MPASRCLEFLDVSFFYPSMSRPVFDALSLRLGPGWTGIVGPNGSGKTTLLRLASGEVEPTRGRVILPPAGVVCCPQRTDDPPEELWAFAGAADALACELRGRLTIADDWPGRWPTLSHGERKRAQIGVALWREPTVLAIDEPTNHIDADARRLLVGALRTFGGTGLLVSHDRELLDTLCAQCVFLDPAGGVAVRPGGYTKGVELDAAEQSRALHEKEQARRQLAKLQSEVAERTREAAQAHKKRSKSGLAPRDSDARGRINLARYSGKDGQAGRLLRQLDGRLAQAQSRAASVRVRKDRRLSADLTGEPSRRAALVRLSARSIPMGERRRLHVPDLIVKPDDRIALVGPNGAGKTTLVRHVLDHLDLPAEKVVALPQEIDVAGARRIVADVGGLDARTLGRVMSAVASLGSEPARVLQSDEPSPGELRKILLALGMSRTPNLIVMDEPTNHLDLPSIECLEGALAQCRCALLLVSHDERFVRRLTRTRWSIARVGDADGDSTLTTGT